MLSGTIQGTWEYMQQMIEIASRRAIQMSTALEAAAAPQYGDLLQSGGFKSQRF